MLMTLVEDADDSVEDDDEDFAEDIDALAEEDANSMDEVIERSLELGCEFI